MYKLLLFYIYGIHSMFSYLLEMKSMFLKFVAVCSCLDTAGICCRADISTVTKSKQ